MTKSYEFKITVNEWNTYSVGVYADNFEEAKARAKEADWDETHDTEWGVSEPQGAKAGEVVIDYSTVEEDKHYPCVLLKGEKTFALASHEQIRKALVHLGVSWNELEKTFNGEQTDIILVKAESLSGLISASKQ